MLVEKVQVIIFRKREGNLEFLLLQRTGKKDFWQGVTGGVELSDKSIQEAAIRELQEELLLDARPEELIGPVYEFSFITQRKGHEGTEAIEYCFGLEVPENTEIHMSPEHDAYQWVAFSQAVAQIAFPEPKKVIKILQEKVA